MYSIGVIRENFSDNKYLVEYLNNFKTEEMELAYIDNQEAMINSIDEPIDAYLIFDDNLESNIPSVCSTILRLRNETNSLIWVHQKELEWTNRIIYLQLGADGSANGERSAKELQLSLSNAFKRRERSTGGPFRTTLKDIRLDSNNLCLQLKEKRVDLTRKEFGLLKLLQSKPGETFTYEEIYEALWKMPYNNKKTRVANIVFRIREKLEDRQVHTRLVHTVHGVGYVFREE